VVKETITLENGSEGYFVRLGDLDTTKKHPMIVIIHGGPFASAPQDIFL
jgi:dipeptidyl aminopeptidase/acylaminoacyl peptidase